MLKDQIGIVTVLYKSKNVFEGFVNSICIQDYTNFELYCIDNDFNQTDSVYYLKILNDKLKNKNYHYLPQNKNIGVAAGNNIGINSALNNNCKFILLSNNDIEFYEKNLFRNILKLNFKYSIIAPKVLYFNSNNIWYRGGHFGFFREVIHENINKNDVFNQNEFITDYAPTCFVMINKDVFEKIGKMDEKYFVYSDDSDFMYRAFKNNINILCTPKYAIFHKVSVSTGLNSPFSIYYGTRNCLYFRKKNRSKINFITYFIYMLLKTILKTFYLNSKQSKSMWLGIFDFFKM